MVKKILILTAGFGEGHNSAARGIRAGLARIAGDAAKVEVHDIFADTYGVANDCAREAYLALINNLPRAWSRVYAWLDRQEKFGGKLNVFFTAKNRFHQLLGRFEPDVIVSVYPAYAHMLDDMLGPSGHSCGKRVVVITDSLSVNAIWYRCSADCFLLPNEPSAAVLHRAGIAPERTKTFGFPVSPEFSDNGVFRLPPSDVAGRRVLYLANARKSAAPELVSRLAAIPGVDLTVAVGRDERLRRAINDVRQVAMRPFQLVGWSEELPRLLKTTHLLISKAGGATVQEALAAGCPMIVNHVIPGQEEGNARFLVETNCGAIATTQQDLVAAVENVFAHDAAVWREWAGNTAALSRPAASLEIARFLLSL